MGIRFSFGGGGIRAWSSARSSGVSVGNSRARVAMSRGTPGRASGGARISADGGLSPSEVRAEMLAILVENMGIARNLAHDQQVAHMRLLATASSMWQPNAQVLTVHVSVAKTSGEVSDTVENATKTLANLPSGAFNRRREVESIVDRMMAVSKVVRSFSESTGDLADIYKRLAMEGPELGLDPEKISESADMYELLHSIKEGYDLCIEAIEGPTLSLRG
ncbi:hypothetical protein ABZ590_11610 [Streptomyces hirsutus]|uniref:hypothetical protein n=1 Tax=Streptomyces hirsutus TaxID=35620 RepID=UPI0033F2CB91